MIENTLSPEWNDDLLFKLDKALEENAELVVEVFDYERIGRSRSLGKCSVPLGLLIKTVREPARTHDDDDDDDDDDDCPGITHWPCPASLLPTPQGSKREWHPLTTASGEAHVRPCRSLARPLSLSVFSPV